jgi:integrase/recombinase XerD
MSVILRKRSNSDGSITLRLDIYHNSERRVETLKHLKLVKPANLLDREHNKQKLQQAQAIAVARAAELEATNYSMITDAGKKTIVTAWMQVYVDAYKKKDVRNMQGALNRFKDFLKQEKKEQLTFGNLNALIIEEFIEYLEHHSKGEGATSYYNRFKKMIKQAYRQRLIQDNPLEFVERKTKGKAKKKDILTLDELYVLNKTSTENAEVKRAFLFSCFTGLRWIDVTKLTWSSISNDGKYMNVSQSKTNEDVSIPLNKTAIKLLGTVENKKGNIFKLPTANGANKTLKAWVKRAKIEKKITWHNARHSFGTNLILNDVDILTASKLLGHTTVKYTHRYVKASIEMKETATHKIGIDLD